MTPWGIEPAIFWFVAQYLNHCATASPPPRILNRSKFNLPHSLVDVTAVKIPFIDTLNLKFQVSPHSSKAFCITTNTCASKLRAPHPTSRPEDHPVSVVSDCLFHISAASIEKRKPSAPPEMWWCNVTGVCWSEQNARLNNNYVSPFITKIGRSESKWK
jgi:hypothetical protein